MNSMVTGHAVLPQGNGRAVVHQVHPPAFITFDITGNELARTPLAVDNAFRQTAFSIAQDPNAPGIFMLMSDRGDVDGAATYAVARLDRDETAATPVRIAAIDALFPGAELMPVRLSLAVAPDGTLAVAEAFSYRIVRLDPEGNVLARFTHAVERPLKSTEALDAALRSARRNGESEEEVDVHDVHFFRTSLDFDDAGRLWVLMNRPDRERSTLDVFAPDGAFVQQLEVPYYILRSMRGADPAIQLGGGHLVAAVLGPDEEDRIKIWRVVEE